jgi:pilus assembly protein CpaB
MNQKIIPLVSVGIGMLAFGLSYHYLRGKDREVAERLRQISEATAKIEVMVANRDIPGGTALKPEDLRVEPIVETSAPDQVVRKSEGRMILGRKTLFQIRAGKPVLWSELEGGAPEAEGLAPGIRAGMRAVSLSVSGAAAVSGLVQPNDRVDILGTFTLPSRAAPGEMETVTLTVLQDVTVLATGQQLARDRALALAAGRATAYATVTVEVSPREAELLVFAQQTQGQLTLTLRNPADISFEKDLPEINFRALESTLPELNLYRQRTIREKKGL